MNDNTDPEARAAMARKERFEKARRRERQIALLEVVVPFLGVVAAMVLLWDHAIDAMGLVLLVVMYTLTLIGIGAGFHRYFSHRSFETTEPVKVLLAIFGSMAAQGPVVYWASIHRIHHARSDKPTDPHSPHYRGSGWRGRLRGLLYSHVGWLFSHKMEEGEGRRHGGDLLLDPTIAAVDRVYLFWVFLGLALPAAVAGLWTSSWAGALSGFLWGGLVRMFLVHHSFWSINSICHLYGTTPFRTRDKSKNNAWVGILAFGDGWHNNHHAFPASPVHGLEWWQFDVNGYFIRTLEFLGLAWDLKLPTKSMLEAQHWSEQQPAS